MYTGAGAPALLASLPMTDSGIDAVRKTLRDMVAIARKYKSDVTCITLSRDILISQGIRDVRHEKPRVIEHLFCWVKANIVYCPDPIDLEMLQTPPRTLEVLTGDCDDQALLLATLLATCGFATRFKAVGGVGPEWSGDESDDGDESYSHVYSEVRLGTRWLALDTIVASSSPGWEPPNIGCLMVAHV
jgi:transglutaminase-like putative cysteine protease